ncbi:SIS domain-containing protein [Candidatus Margulisiibacteriota bacterium]
MSIEDINKYYDELNKFVKQIKVKDKKGKELKFSDGAERAVKIMLEQHAEGKKVMFIGNGGSAAIASHMAVDFWKNGRIPATAFNDSSLLTCISNDYGYERVFEKPIEAFAGEGDVLMAISSSGKSKNILNGVKAAESKKCKVITFSGFSPDNTLYKTGDLNFYVPSSAYSHVEIIHHTIIHYMLDMVIKWRSSEGDDD